MHLIWLSLTLPPTMLLVMAFPVMRRREVWWMVTGIVVGLLVALVGWDFFQYSQEQQEWNYSLTRVAFVLVRTTDFPLVAMALGSLISLTISLFTPSAKLVSCRTKTK